MLGYEHALDKELLQKEKSLYEEWLSRQPLDVERPIYTLSRAILRRDKATTGTRYPTDENECDREIEDIILRQQAQDGPTERTRSETDSGDSHCADHHQKPITRVKDENGDVSKRSNHSAAAATTCSYLGDDSPLLKDSIHRSDDERGEQNTKRSRVVTPPTGDIVSRNRGNNSDDELHKRFLCVLEESSVDPRDEESSTVEVKQLTYEQKNSEATMVDYARELAFLPDLAELTPTKLDYGGKNVI